MSKAIDTAIDHINKKFGAGSVMHLSDTPIGNIEVIPTGCLSFDLMTGMGGFPRGRNCEIYGQGGVGKSTLAYHLVSQAQSMDLNCAYIDVEHAFSESYAVQLGVDPQKLLISQPDDAESALEITEILIRSGDMALVVIDSVDALVPRAVIDGEHGDKHVALLARLMSQGLRKLTGLVDKANTCLLFINQIRQGIPIGGYGPVEFTSGGVALKFYTTIRIEIKRIASVKDREENIIGNKLRIKTVKNKISAPYKECEVDLIFGKGFSVEGDLFTLGTETGVIKQSGHTYHFGELKLGVGRQAVLTTLTENDNDIMTTMRLEVLKAKGL